MIKDDQSTYEQMALVEKYEQFINYCYPIMQSFPRKHGVARDMMLSAMFTQVDLLVQAGKSGTVSRLYAADANLALLRFWFRFASDSKRKLITTQQHKTALVLLAEVGKMLGAWIKGVKGKG